MAVRESIAFSYGQVSAEGTARSSTGHQSIRSMAVSLGPNRISNGIMDPMNEGNAVADEALKQADLRPRLDAVDAASDQPKNGRRKEQRDVGRLMERVHRVERQKPPFRAWRSNWWSSRNRAARSNSRGIGEPDRPCPIGANGSALTDPEHGGLADAAHCRILAVPAKRSE